MKIDVLALLRDQYPLVLDKKSDFVKNSLKDLPNSKTHLNNFDELFDKDSQYIEETILKQITETLSETESFTGCNYFTAITNSLSANVRDGSSNIIVVDELISCGLTEFYTIVLQWSIDLRDEKIYRYAFRQLIYLLDMEFTKKGLGTISIEDDAEWLHSLNENAMTIASDCYWVSWSFIVLHEIGHLVLGHTKIPYNVNQEYEADEFAYKMIINLIKKFRCSSSDLMSVFQQYTCYAPMMLFDFYRIINMYQGVVYPELKSPFNPDPQSRIDQLITLINEESFDDSPEIDILGIDVYNNYLDVLDYFWEQFIIKYKKGKLIFLHDIKP